MAISKARAMLRYAREHPELRQTQAPLSTRVSNLFFEYGRTHAHPATDMLIGRRESDEIDAYIERLGVHTSAMTKNDDQFFMGLRFVRTSALSQLVVGCFLVEK